MKGETFWWILFRNWDVPIWKFKMKNSLGKFMYWNQTFVLKWHLYSYNLETFVLLVIFVMRMRIFINLRFFLSLKLLWFIVSIYILKNGTNGTSTQVHKHIDFMKKKCILWLCCYLLAKYLCYYLCIKRHYK